MIWCERRYIVYWIDKTSTYIQETKNTNKKQLPHSQSLLSKGPNFMTTVRKEARVKGQQLLQEHIQILLKNSFRRSLSSLVTADHETASRRTRIWSNVPWRTFCEKDCPGAGRSMVSCFALCNKCSHEMNGTRALAATTRTAWVGHDDSDTRWGTKSDKKLEKEKHGQQCTVQLCWGNLDRTKKKWWPNRTEKQLFVWYTLFLVWRRTLTSFVLKKVSEVFVALLVHFY